MSNFDVDAAKAVAGKLSPIRSERTWVVVGEIHPTDNCPVSPIVDERTAIELAEKMGPEFIPMPLALIRSAPALLAKLRQAESALAGLLDAIHDSMTHESQHHHTEQINEARAALAAIREEKPAAEVEFKP